MRQTASLILDALFHAGVAHHSVTAITGMHVAPIVGELIRRWPGRPFVECQHESLSVGMSVGSALQSGQVHLAIVTGGPGATNAVSALAGAKSQHAPVVLLIGETKAGSDDRSQIQGGDRDGLDYESMFSGIAPVWRAENSRAAQVCSALSVRHAAENRGPAVLVIPRSVQELDGQGISIISTHRGSKHSIDNAASFLVEHLGAARPIIIAGRGTVATMPMPAIARLHAAGFPVLWTPECKGYGDTVGLGMTERVRGLLEASDTLIALGCNLNDIHTAGLPHERIAWHWPLTPERGGAGRPTAHVSIQTWRETEQTINAALDQLAHGCRWRPSLPPESDHPEPEPESGPVSPGTALSWLSELASTHRGPFTVAADIGAHTAFAVREYELARGDQWLLDIEHAAMGSGLAVAMGAAHSMDQSGEVANASRALGIVGDGAMKMYLGALADIRRMQLPLTLAIIDNGGWAMVADGIRTLCKVEPGPHTFQGDDVPIESVCERFCRTHVIRTRADLEAVSEPFTGEPCILVFKVNGDTTVSERIGDICHPQAP